MRCLLILAPDGERVPHLSAVGDDEPHCLAALQIQRFVEYETHRIEQVDVNGAIGSNGVRRLTDPARVPT